MRRQPARRIMHPSYPHHLELMGAPGLMLSVGLALGLGAGCREEGDDSGRGETDPPGSETGADTGDTQFVGDTDTEPVEGDTYAPPMLFSFWVEFGLRDGQMVDAQHETGPLPASLWVGFFDKEWMESNDDRYICWERYAITGTPGTSDPAAWYDFDLDPVLDSSECWFSGEAELAARGMSLGELELTLVEPGEELLEQVEQHGGESWLSSVFGADLFFDGQALDPELGPVLMGNAYSVDDEMLTTGELLGSAAVAGGEDAWVSVSPRYYWVLL